MKLIANSVLVLGFTASFLMVTGNAHANPPTPTPTNTSTPTYTDSAFIGGESGGTPIPTPTYTLPPYFTLPPTSALPLFTPFCAQCHENIQKSTSRLVPLPPITKMKGATE